MDRKLNKNSLVGFLVCTTGVVFVLLFAHWQPRADFDVTGTLWLMQNILPFTLFCILFAGAAGALVVWLRGRFSKKMSSEE